jgi:2-phospho-L-lactate guanylyltransferase
MTREEEAAQKPYGGVWALVPVKCFARGKSRLASVLGQAEREELAQSFCEHVLESLAGCDGLAGVLVVTDSAIVEATARTRGAEVARDGAAASLGSLGAIVDDALAILARRGARSAIVLMSDLPRLESSDVESLVRALDGASVVLAPDRHDEGTNALGLSPPDRFPTCFGTKDSFRRHRERAIALGASVVVHRSEGLAWDVDSPEDLALVRDYAVRGARLSWKRKRPSRVSAA